MRALLAIVAILTCNYTIAQTHLPVPVSPYAAWQPFGQLSPLAFNPAAASFNSAKRQWQVVPYASAMAGYIFYNGGISYLSAPMGVMLIRPLTNNIAVFGNASIAPTVFNINRLYTGPSSLNVNPGAYGAGGSGRIEAGLMYTNDDKTFSISGSVGVERGYYPAYQQTRSNGSAQKSGR